MATPYQRPPGVVPVPPDIKEYVADVLDQHGQRGAAERLGVTRHVVLTVVAGLDVRAGSLALLRAAMREAA